MSPCVAGAERRPARPLISLALAARGCAGMPAPSRFDHLSATKSNSTRSIATHPCKERKDGAPSVGMVHAKIVEGGTPADLFKPPFLFQPMPSCYDSMWCDSSSLMLIPSVDGARNAIRFFPSLRHGIVRYHPM